MNYRHMTTNAAFLLVLLLAQAASAKDCDRIQRVPAVIEKPGAYCLARTLETDLSRGAAIEIRASNVHLDLKGNTLGNRVDRGACLNGNEDNPTVGIRAVGANNVTITGGTIHCFSAGIEIFAEDLNCLSCSFGHTIRDVNLKELFAAGVLVRASQSTIEHNHVFRIGGNRDREARGIIVNGSGNTVRGNDVQFLFGARNTGIAAAGGNANLVVENRVQQAETGFALFGGQAVRYRDNLTAEVGFGYFGNGQDLGNNQ